MRFFTAFMLLIFTSAYAKADLKFEPLKLNQDQSILVVSGTFEYDDDLKHFINAVKIYNPVLVTFESGGGNVVKAIELGRMIRLLQLNTVQIRGAECSSACALAFLGGVQRYAEAGAIGVHKSSFSDTTGMNVSDAVSSVQQLTADVMSYINDMGADTNLLQLSLRYDSDDMRYLSLREMEQFHIVNRQDTDTRPITTTPHPPAYQPAPIARTTPDYTETPAPRYEARKPSVNLSIPTVLTGVVNHPNGKAKIVIDPNNKSRTLIELRNSSNVHLRRYDKQWYKVGYGDYFGYMHHSWVKPDQYETRLTANRYIQIMSFATYEEALDYIQKSPLQLAAYLSSNEWIGVTLEQMYPLDRASTVIKSLKKSKKIPSDSIITTGNPYVRKICCQ